MNLINKWIEWNEKKITGDDFCIAFGTMFEKEIKERIIKRKLVK